MMKPAARRFSTLYRTLILAVVCFVSVSPSGLEAGGIDPHSTIGQIRLETDLIGFGGLSVEDERRQRHPAHTNECCLAPFHLKTAERRTTGTWVRVDTKAVA